MRLIDAQRWLLVLWIVLAGTAFVIMSVRTLGPNSAEMRHVWEWFLPSMMPSLTLVVTTYISSTQHEAASRREVDRSVITLAALLSAFYLAAILAALIYYPLRPSPQVEVLHSANLILGPLQGLVSAALGAVFIRGANARRPK
jgi:hypothetical protein